MNNTELSDQEIDGLATLGEWYIITPSDVPNPIGRKYWNSPIPTAHPFDDQQFYEGWE